MQTLKFEGFVFGTTYYITLETARVFNYQKSIDSLFYLVNKSTSTYIPTSDISKINAGDSTIVVDAIFSEVFKKSKQVFLKTDGYFDPTVGDLVNAWGFGPEEAKKEISDEEVERIMH